MKLQKLMNILYCQKVPVRSWWKCDTGTKSAELNLEKFTKKYNVPKDDFSTEECDIGRFLSTRGCKNINLFSGALFCKCPVLQTFDLRTANFAEIGSNLRTEIRVANPN